MTDSKLAHYPDKTYLLRFVITIVMKLTVIVIAIYSHSMNPMSHEYRNSHIHVI
jgi:hypothetical protein